MKSGKMKRRIAALVLLLLLAVGQAGCSMLKSGIHDLHGSIFGNEYNIDIFDNMGIRTLRTHGEKIDIDNNVVEETSYSSDSNGWFTTKTLSSVITITIDGKQLISCGDTCIFYDTRLSPEYEFYLDDIDSQGEQHQKRLRQAHGGGHQVPDGRAYLRLLREQGLLGGPGGLAQVHQAHDRRQGPLYPPGQLPDHRQGIAGLKQRK